METRAELNARLKLAEMPKGIYARLFGTTPQIVSRHGHQHRIPPVAESLVRAWELMTPEQREEWVDIEKAKAA